MTSRFQEQNSTTEPRRHFTKFGSILHSNLSTKLLVLANFSQLAPLCATFHLCCINTYLCPHFFHLQDMGVVGCSLFSNQPFGSYFLNPWMNKKNVLWGNDIFCVINLLLSWISLYIGPILRKIFPIGEIWSWGQIPTSIFIFWYKYTYLGLLLTCRKKKKFLSNQAL